MKRDMEPINLRDAFQPMPEGCYDALMHAARSVKEEKTVKRAALRTIAIAACIILAATAAAIAAGSILGWNDFFRIYSDTAVPQTAQQIMAASEPVTYRLGDVVFTVRERYGDAHLAMISTEARLIDGVKGIITADAPFDPIGAYGESSAAAAARLGVDADMTWAEAAKQLNLPLYSVSVMLEAPAELCGSSAFSDPLFNEDGSLSCFSLQELNGAADMQKIDCPVWLMVRKINVEDPQDASGELTADEQLEIALQPTLETKAYAVPDAAKTWGNFVLESIQGELTPSGVYLTAAFTAQEGATEEEAYETLGEMYLVQPDGSEYPIGIGLSGGIDNLDSWSTIEVRQMISVEKLPESIGLILPGQDDVVCLNLIK